MQDVATVNYDVKNSDLIKLDLFDVTGKIIETVVNEKQAAGAYSITFAKNNLSDGLHGYHKVLETLTTVA